MVLSQCYIYITQNSLKTLLCSLLMCFCASIICFQTGKPIKYSKNCRYILINWKNSRKCENKQLNCVLDLLFIYLFVCLLFAFCSFTSSVYYKYIQISHLDNILDLTYSFIYYLFVCLFIVICVNHAFSLFLNLLEILKYLSSMSLLSIKPVFHSLHWFGNDLRDKSVFNTNKRVFLMSNELLNVSCTQFVVMSLKRRKGNDANHISLKKYLRKHYSLHAVYIWIISLALLVPCVYFSADFSLINSFFITSVISKMTEHFCVVQYPDLVNHLFNYMDINKEDFLNSWFSHTKKK